MIPFFYRGSETLLGWQELEKSVLGREGTLLGHWGQGGSPPGTNKHWKREAKDVLNET